MKGEEDQSFAKEGRNAKASHAYNTAAKVTRGRKIKLGTEFVILVYNHGMKFPRRK